MSPSLPALEFCHARVAKTCVKTQVQSQGSQNPPFIVCACAGDSLLELYTLSNREENSALLAPSAYALLAVAQLYMQRYTVSCATMSTAPQQCLSAIGPQQALAWQQSIGTPSYIDVRII